MAGPNPSLQAAARRLANVDHEHERPSVLPHPFPAPKAAKQTFLSRTSTCENPTWRNRSSWNSRGRGVSSVST